MNDDKMIHAITEVPGEYNTYPAYLNLSKRNGGYLLTVRTRDEYNASVIELTTAEVMKLANDIINQ